MVGSGKSSSSGMAWRARGAEQQNARFSALDRPGPAPAPQGRRTSPRNFVDNRGLFRRGLRRACPMPHIVVEYTPNLGELPLDAMLAAATRHLTGSPEVTDEADLKARVLRAEHFRV